MIRSPQCSGHDLAKRFNRPGHAKGRIQRAGQTAEKVQYFHLLARGTVDERIMQALADKRDISKMVVDEWREIISGRREA